jgi:hypothetical protein
MLASSCIAAQLAASQEGLTQLHEVSLISLSGKIFHLRAVAITTINIFGLLNFSDPGLLSR